MKMIVEKLTKERLDQMSEDEIENHRYQFLSLAPHSTNWGDTEEKRYIDELELYTNIRFKDKVLARFQRWRTDPDPDVSKLFSKIPDETLYRLNFDSFKEKYGQPKYIPDLDLP